MDATRITEHPTPASVERTFERERPGRITLIRVGEPLVF